MAEADDAYLEQLAEYVEDQLDVLVESASAAAARPFVWAKASEHSWVIGLHGHDEHGEYTLSVHPEQRAFFVTHSNARVGVLGLHHYMTTGTRIPFDLVTSPLPAIVDPFIARLRRPLAELVLHVISTNPPDVESPT